MMETKEYYLVAAIEVGTSSSGYAYSFSDEYKDNPLRIRQNFDDAFDKYLRTKYPTYVLLNPDREFLAFGCKAEELYSDLILSENHSDYYFFKEFTIKLRETQELSRTILIKDVKGKKVPALDLITHVIIYMKDHLLSLLDMRKTTLENEDIHWVLPVPAIWKDSAKNFMREAANKAGILTEQLTICLVPEAVLTYCQHLPADLLMGNLSFSPGTKWIIIDLESKTADIYIYQKKSDGSLKEVYIFKGGPWVGDKVNEAFDRMMIKIVGACCFQKFKDDKNEDYFLLHTDLETKKRTFDPKSNSRVSIHLPMSLIGLLAKETDAKMSNMIQQTEYANKMTFIKATLRMEADLFKELFKEPVDMLVEHLQQLMAEDNLSGISAILMVGGFSESLMVTDAIMKAFPDKRVIIPEDAELAVLKGAVLFGHQSHSVLESAPPGLL